MQLAQVGEQERADIRLRRGEPSIAVLLAAGAYQIICARRLPQIASGGRARIRQSHGGQAERHFP